MTSYTSGDATGRPDVPRARRRGATVFLAVLASGVLVAGWQHIGRGGEAALQDRDAIPLTGSGKFVTARSESKAVGSGSVRRYKVQVEDTVDLPVEATAGEIAAVLGDPRGWTADGKTAFQLVGSGRADFTIKIATPGTVDDICGAAGLETEGKVNCTVGTTVAVNLKRWMAGSPRFDGPIGEYRALIINHEVGHRLGHGHEGCPGPGRPAPAMMQQIKGLDGCKANAWPYDRKGNYLQGPSVP